MALIRIVMPFIIYQKMQTVVVKYMYIVEKYGYLTKLEYDNLLSDIISCGIEASSINIEYPSTPEPYGTLLKLRVEGNYISKFLIFNDSISEKITTTNLSVTKYSYSKI